MSEVKNKTSIIFHKTLIILCVILYMVTPLMIFAVDDLGSITINYVDNSTKIENGESIKQEIALEGAEFSISLVAVEDSQTGKFVWIDSVANDAVFGYKTEDILDKEVFKDVANALISMQSEQLTKRSKTTDENGQCIFSELERGIYLVWESNKEGIAQKYHEASPFFIEVPNRSEYPYNFDVVAYPKTEFITERLVSVQGTKSWVGKDIVGTEKDTTSDNPNEIKVYRPDTITLHLYANGIEVAKTTTSAEQNWSFAFNDVNILDENGDNVVFTIKEDAVQGYKFSQDEPVIGENTIIINITNTVDESAAQTGDDTNLMRWVIIVAACVTGIIIVLTIPTKKKQ